MFHYQILGHFKNVLAKFNSSSFTFYSTFTKFISESYNDTSKFKNVELSATPDSIYYDVILTTGREGGRADNHNCFSKFFFELRIMILNT